MRLVYRFVKRGSTTYCVTFSGQTLHIDRNGRMTGDSSDCPIFGAGYPLPFGAGARRSKLAPADQTLPLPVGRGACRNCVIATGGDPPNDGTSPSDRECSERQASASAPG